MRSEEAKRRHRERERVRGARLRALRVRSCVCGATYQRSKSPRCETCRRAHGLAMHAERERRRRALLPKPKRRCEACAAIVGRYVRFCDECRRERRRRCAESARARLKDSWGPLCACAYCGGEFTPSRHAWLKSRRDGTNLYDRMSCAALARTAAKRNADTRSCDGCGRSFRPDGTVRWRLRTGRQSAAYCDLRCYRENRITVEAT